MVNLVDMPESTSTTIAGRIESAAAQFEEVKPTIDVRDLTFAYGNHEVLHEVSLQIPPRAVTAFIGRSESRSNTPHSRIWGCRRRLPRFGQIHYLCWSLHTNSDRDSRKALRNSFNFFGRDR